jgi:hypothetical protein
MKRRRAVDCALDQIFPLTEFIRTYLARHPNAEDLADLRVDDIDAFARLSCIRSDGESRPTHSVHIKLSAIRTFLTFVLGEQPSLLPATFQPRWLWGRVIDRHGQPVLKSDAPAQLTLVETPKEAELRAQAYFQRDAWDIDVLPGVSRKDHWHQKTLSFVSVPETYRSAAKAYGKHLLAAKGQSLSSLIANIRHLARFLEFWAQRYPDRTSLADRPSRTLPTTSPRFVERTLSRTTFTIVTTGFGGLWCGFNVLSIRSRQCAWRTACSIRPLLPSSRITR